MTRDPAAGRWWETTRLEDLDPEQWESLCDGCGKCCVIRLEDEDNGDIHMTDVACRLLDGQACRCTRYPERQSIVPDCVRLTPDNARALNWLPRTCAYRLVAEGRPLADWHPLVSGDPESVHIAGMSVRGATVPETRVRTRHLPRRIRVWPGEAAD